MTHDEALAEAERTLDPNRGPVIAKQREHEFLVGQEPVMRNGQIWICARFFCGASWQEAVDLMKQIVAMQKKAGVAA